MDWPWDSGTTSLAGLLGVCILSILTGLLIPRWLYNHQVSFWKQRYKDLEKTNERLETRNELLAGAVGKLTEYAETADRILRALPAPTPVRREVDS